MLNYIKQITLFFALFTCVSILFAQENGIESKKLPLPKYEFAFSVGDNLLFQISVLDLSAIEKGYGSYTLSYHKRNNKVDWFWFGFYHNLFNWMERDFGYAIVSIAPSLRFSYLNKPNATLYSGLSVGVGTNLPYHRISPFFQVTAFGFSYGKNFFASGEVGLGLKGIFSANVGYRW